MHFFKTFSDYINCSTFLKELMIAMHVIVVKRGEASKKRSVIDWDSDLGDSILNDKEKYLEQIFQIVAKLLTYFEDLDKVMIFLKVDRSKIQILYEKKLDVDDYYKYHYDNFVIRILTSIDVCGKIGNIVLNLNIPEKKANWYSFTVHPATKDSESAKKLIEFSSFLETFKKLRHSKVHSGHNPFNRFDKVLFIETFEDLDVNIGGPAKDYFEEYTDRDLQEAIKEIEEIISKAAMHSIEFLDTMTDQLKGIINE